MGTGENLTLLRSAVFEDIPERTVEELCACGRVISLEVDHKLFERGESARELMILQQGVVELVIPVRIMGVTREVTLESKQAGDVVAWSALVKPYRFTLSARCASQSTLVNFSRDTLHDFFETSPSTGYLFMRNLAGVIGRRLQTMQTMWMHDLEATVVRRFE